MLYTSILRSAWGILDSCFKMSDKERECQAAFVALTDCFAELVKAKTPLKWLSRKLFTVKIITLDQLEEADLPLPSGLEKERC